MIPDDCECKLLHQIYGVGAVHAEHERNTQTERCGVCHSERKPGMAFRTYCPTCHRVHWSCCTSQPFDRNDYQRLTGNA